jgi:Tfp pilus assembly protein PilZ
LAVKIPIKYHLEEDRKILKTRNDLVKGTRHGFTLDLSPGGMSVVLDDPLKGGEVILFDLYLLHQRDNLKIYSQVRWVGPKSVGLRFLAMKPEDAKVLEDFLEKAPS